LMFSHSIRGRCKTRPLKGCNHWLSKNNQPSGCFSAAT